MIEFRKNASRDSLYDLAVKNGVPVPQDADRDTIIQALTAYNTQEAADGATDSADAAAEGRGTDNTTAEENAAQRPIKAAEDYGTFAYAGPSIPGGRLKENAVFRGKLSDVLEYLADVIEEFPQVPRLIVPTERLAAFSVKVKTPGNIAHKYYTEIVSAVRNKRKRGVTNG